MFQDTYEEMVRFASKGDLEADLQLARAEYLERTGELFESDSAYDRRIAAFLEWYVLDRPVRAGTHQTPAKLYIDAVTPDLTTPEIQRLRGLTKTTLSLFEFRKAKKDHLDVVDLLTGYRHKIFERRKPAGLESKDILEARLVPFDNKILFSDVFTVLPRDGRKAILRTAKRFRKTGGDNGRLDVVHRVTRLANRCDRYPHVSPEKIFRDL
ncbi:MAG: hypothetical protein V3T05_00330 [Myxococcota bacterium]